MTTRRGFLSAMTGAVAFCGCGMTGPAHAAMAPAKRPVAVNGKKVKTIDIHSHCHFKDAIALMGGDQSMLNTAVKGAMEAFIAVEQRTAAMDSQAIDMEVLSVNPFWYNKDRDLAAKVVEVQNEQMAALVASKPDRFAGFASLTLQDPQLAVQQLEKAMKKQGLKGAAVGDRVNDWELSNPALHPVWAKAEELGAVLFIHPQGVPEITNRLKGNGWLGNTIGNPLGTTIALSHLIFEGTLDKYPGLKIVSAHGGGFLPSYADRSDHACFVSPPGCDPNVKLKKKPTEYLKQLYFDTLIFEPEALRHLAAQVGVSQLMLGSDYPYPWEMHPVDHVLRTNTLNDQQKLAILGGNAARILGIKA